MPESVTEKYHVRNLDCAACAAKIENGLQKLDGVEFASLDFAGQILLVKTADPQRIVDYVKRLGPEVELIPKDRVEAVELPPSDVSSYRFKKEAAVLILSAVLFGGILFIEHGAFAALRPSVVLSIVAAAYLLAGWNVIRGAFQTIKRGMLFDENVLMVIATGGAIAIQAHAEAVGVMIFYKVGELLQEMAVSRSRRSIQSLLAAKPDKAMLKTSAGLEEVPPESVDVGALIEVRPGEKIPLDGEVISGRSQIDTSVLTGESVPVSAEPGDRVLAGQINRSGVLTVTVRRPFNESSIAKVMDLVQNAAARKARTEKFITTFARYYTPAVVLIAAGVAFAPPLLTGDPFRLWIYRALVLLVISCPCALVISIPLGYFGGIGRASRRGILVKGSNFIDALTAVSTVVFDKTGTLTRGVFNVKGVVGLNGFTGDQVLEMAAAAEYQSNHPIAAAILAAFAQTGRQLDTSRISDHTDFAGKGVTARYADRTVLVGNDNFLHFESIEHHQCEFDNTVAHVAVDGRYAGYILIGDEIKPEAAQAVRELRAQGVVHISMLTGDNHCAAEAVSQTLRLDSFHADLLPEDKVRAFESLTNTPKNRGRAAFVGDGINDAPVIARADVGVAMGAMGSDAAVETADVVLMTDSPLKMAEAVAIARLTRRIVWQNICLAFVVKGVFIGLGVMGLATMWGAVFADMGTALLAVGNSTRIIGKRA